MPRHEVFVGRSIIVALCLLSCARQCPSEQQMAGMSQYAWLRYRGVVLQDPALLRFYTFEEVQDAAAPVPNLAADKAASLSFKVAQKAGAPVAQWQVIEGRWPGKKAVRLDQGYLAGPPFEVTHKAFTVEAWLRKNGPGTHRGNNESTNGTLLSVGIGYWDGWRLTTDYPRRWIGFEIGRPKPVNAVGIRTEAVSDGVWHHLAATWDGQEMRVYVDGLLASAGPYTGDYTPPAPGAELRIGYAGYGFGSVILDVDEVAIYARALGADEILRHAYFYAPMNERVSNLFSSANQRFDQKDYAAAAGDYAKIVAMEDVSPDLRSLARLRLGLSLWRQRQMPLAVQQFAEVFGARGVSERDRKAALTYLLQLIGQGAGDVVPVNVYKEALVMPEMTPVEKRTLRLNLARCLRSAQDFAAAQEQYTELLALSDLPARDRLNIHLELGHTLCEAGDYALGRAEYARVLTMADAPAHFRSNAQLRIAESFVRQKDYAAAIVEYEKATKMADAPGHHRWEAQERLKQIERLRAGLPSRDAAESRVKLPKGPPPAIKFYVAPAGSDTNTGTQERPFATLERARDEIRALKRKGDLPDGGVAVIVRGGEYRVKETFKLTTEDSGTEKAPILYTAHEGETPILTGGMRISGFQAVRDPAILTRLPEEARGKVLQIDLKALGVRDLGQFTPGGFGSGAGFKTHPRLELFFNGQAMPVARWPNEGFVKIVEVLGAQPLEVRGKVMGTKDGKFAYEGDRPNRWQQEHDLWLYGYWFHDWSDSYEKVASIDTEKRVITLSPPYHRSGYRKGMRYYAINLLSEIDRPGEWYLDRRSGILYFYPPSDAAKATVEISMLNSPMVETDETSYVTFRGLTWELGRGDGVIIKKGMHCLLAGCTIRKLAGDGVVIDGGSHHGILGCDIHNLGRGGTRIKGGDRKTLTPGQHFVENCHIYDFSRIDRTYTPAVLMEGCGNRIAHNLFHDSPCHAMRIEGNDHLIEFNEVHSVVWESDDQGGVDMWGNPTYRGNIYRYNYWHHIGSGLSCGQAGIRLDDAISGTLIYGNVFYRCSDANFGGVQIHGGKDNIVDNNLFVDCKHAISFTPWGEKRWKEFLANTGIAKKIQEVNIGQPPYSVRYPELARLYENADVNMIWRNSAYKCESLFARDPGCEDVIDNYVSSRDPGVIDAATGRLVAKGYDSPAPGIMMPPIPFEEIGLYEDALRASWPAVHRVRKR